MKAILDTHVILWWVTNNPQLSQTARDIISDSSNTLYVSVVSSWEIIIKAQTGKLPLPEPPTQFIQSCLMVNRFVSLPIDLSHVLQVDNLPHHHKDPFDRILIAQAQVENIPLITIDHLIVQYPVQTLW
jgi:PIN domain nuclease of toxin-antitoxin system